MVIDLCSSGASRKTMSVVWLMMFDDGLALNLEFFSMVELKVNWPMRPKCSDPRLIGVLFRCFALFWFVSYYITYLIF